MWGFLPGLFLGAKSGAIMTFLVASKSIESPRYVQICRLTLKAKAYLEGIVDHVLVIEEDIFNFLDNLYHPRVME